MCLCLYYKSPAQFEITFEFVFLQFLRHPHSLTIYEDWLYWSDRAASRVSRCKKFNCTDRSVVASSISRPLGIAAYNIVKQPPGRESSVVVFVSFFVFVEHVIVGLLFGTLCIRPLQYYTFCSLSQTSLLNQVALYVSGCFVGESGGTFHSTVKHGERSDR